MSEKLNMALAGVGRIGVTHLAVLSQASNVCLKAIVEPREEVGRKYAEAYHCDYYKDISELAAREDIQAVDICVPEEYHVVASVAAAKAGKHILLEKPLAKTYDECQQIINAAKENNVRLMVAHTCHFMPQYQRVRNECHDGRIGELTEVAIRRYGPRVTNEYVKGRVTIGFYMAIHDLDASMWMTGHKITEVFAEKIDKLGLYGEDGLDMVFKYDNGACGTMNVSWTLPAAYPGSVAELDLLGDKGVIRMQPYNSGVMAYTDRVAPVSLVQTKIDGQMWGAYTNEVEHFADAIINNKEFNVDNEESAYSVRLIEAALRSVESHKPELV